MYKTIERTEILSKEDIEELNKMSFSEISSIYEDDEIIEYKERRRYFEDNFYDAKYDKDDKRLNFFKIGWPYIYSLNIDDAIEKSTDYTTTVLPNREFNEDIFEKQF